MTAHSIMVLGTGSHVGKSIITAGIGRILADEGYRVAPFKAQNMSLNSAVTPDGLEIGRAQALQAEACRVPSAAEMNPILIKPRTDTSSQIVVLGRVWTQATASEYHTKLVEELFPVVVESYAKLASIHDVVVLEGAGSPAEINLREHDIVNMRMARVAAASCLLVGDIDRGGVFASLVGTVELLEPWERELVKGFIINKFRGDQALLQPGIEMIERRLGLPCVGVVHYLQNIGLEEEDSVAVPDRRTAQRVWQLPKDSNSPERPLRVGVIAVPHMSNFTDFDALASEPSISLAFLDRADDIPRADFIILPGSKQTLDDLHWLRQNGFFQRLKEHHAKNGGILGICGGLQMLGTKIDDPQGIENDGAAVEEKGLDLLPIETTLRTVKTTRPVRGSICADSFRGQPWPSSGFQGYEIHMGETQYLPGAHPLAKLADSRGESEWLDGVISSDGKVFGTYVHGIFDTDEWRHDLINLLRTSAGLSAAKENSFVSGERDARLNRLADHLRKSLNVELILSWAGKPFKPPTVVSSRLIF